MKHAKRHLIAAGLLALGLAAGAQTTPPGPPPGGPGAGPGYMMMHGHHGRFDPAKMQEYRAQRQAQLKQKLQLTPGQEGAWTAYVAAMQPPANMQRRDPAEWAKLTTPERIDRMRALRTEHQAVMDKHADAMKTFYASLTPEQKKVFDAESMRGHGGRRGGMRHRG